LARVAAQAGQKVIVIDADLRNPTVAKTIGIKNMSGGVVGALTGQIPLNKAIIKDPHSTAHFLAAEQKAPNPSDLLNSKTMERLITSLRTHYDLVVIDSAPLLPVSDTKALLRVADTAVVAVRWEKTPRDAVLSVTRTLAEMKAPVAGIVLTRANTKRFRQYSYGHQNYAAYDRYYGD
jgi:capsular exopolysaccharide synthesis family protein